VADALTPMIEAARANGLSIYAWMTTKYAVYGGYENNLRSYDFKSGKIVPSFGVDIFDDREVERLVKIYRDLARYDIDGVLFQDDLVLRHAEGMGDGASKHYGKRIRPEALYISPYLNPAGTKYYVREYTDEFWSWSSFKSRRLALVAKRIMAGARGVNPSLKFAVNLSYESAIRPDLALAWFSQDIGEFKTDRNGTGADYFFIMAYHRQMMREKSYGDICRVAPLINSVCNNAVFVVGRPERLVIKLQVTDWKTGEAVADGELVEVASYLCRPKEISIAFVPFRADAPLSDVRRVVRMSGR
jgi:biofilm PGA synthesis lipoprotein PgaB